MLSRQVLSASRCLRAFSLFDHIGILGWTVLQGLGMWHPVHDLTWMNESSFALPKL